MVLNIAVIVYNRPTFTEKTLQRVVAARPASLFILADGPKSGSERDKIKVAETRKVVERICASIPYQLVASEVNLGLRKRVETGLDTAFEQVDHLIILEDDCLPAATFFGFADLLLERYATNVNIGRISAQCRWDSRYSQESYQLVQSSGIWGWATWANRWHEYREWSDSEPTITFRTILTDILKTPGIFRKMVRIRLLSSKKSRYSWGVRMSVFMKSRNLYGLSPRVDLVQNVGFGPEATHTQREILPGPSPSELELPLRHPPKLEFDRRTERRASRRDAILFLKHAFIPKLKFSDRNRP